MIPRASAAYHRRQQRISVRLLAALRGIWRSGMQPTGRWTEQYRDGVGPQATMLVAAAQNAATRDADTYVADLLNELDYGPATESGLLFPRGFVGVAGDGRPVQSLLEQAVTAAGKSYNDRASPGRLVTPAPTDDLAAEALEDGLRWMEQVAATIMADTARAAESAAAAARPWVDGYVRMLNLPSCSRCAVLAGRFYLWNDGFQRHPLCDCRHIPAPEATAGDLVTNADTYFRSLPTAAHLNAEHPDLTVAIRRAAGLVSQEDIFGVDGARAIRDGADITQVVNARRGMQTAQVAGRDIVVSTEGTTRHGRANRRRTGRNATTRLMPESIYEVAENRADAIRLLRVNGFIT